MDVGKHLHVELIIFVQRHAGVRYSTDIHRAKFGGFYGPAIPHFSVILRATMRLFTCVSKPISPSRLPTENALNSPPSLFPRLSPARHKRL